MPDRQAEEFLDATTLREELADLAARRRDAIEWLASCLAHELSLSDLAFELDNMLAERQYDLVTEHVRHAATALRSIRATELLDLAEIAIPDAATPGEDMAQTRTVPTLRATPLPQQVSDDFGELEPDEQERQLQHNAEDCAQRIRDILHFYNEDLCSTIVAAASAGDHRLFDEACTAAAGMANPLIEAHERWMHWIGELYVANPGSLGDVGWTTKTIETWLLDRGPRR